MTDGTRIEVTILIIRWEAAVAAAVAASEEVLALEEVLAVVQATTAEAAVMEGEAASELGITAVLGTLLEAGLTTG